MKKTIITIAALSLMLTAFRTNTEETKSKQRIASGEQMAQRITMALNDSSVEAFAGLFPTLPEFKDVMAKNSSIYGVHLTEAQRDFAKHYENELLPALKNSFGDLLREGREKGIDWSTARYVGVELEEQPRARFSTVPVIIVIASNGKEYRIMIEKALVIDGQWKVSQFVRLV